MRYAALCPQEGTHTMPRRRITQAAVAAAVEATNDLVEQAPAQASAPLPPDPVNGPLPKLTRFAGVVERIYTTEGLDIDAEYDRLENALALNFAGAQSIDDSLNTVQRNALDAHRLYLLAVLDVEAFKIDNDVAMGAYRQAATAALQAEKDAGQRSKQITDADVRDRAAVMYPEQWREGTEEKLRAEGLLEQLRRLAELWKERSYALGKMKKGAV